MMVLYSGTTCPFSQRCRLVLFEKGMDFEVRDVDLFNKPEDISTMNPYGQVPILVERDLILRCRTFREAIVLPKNCSIQTFHCNVPTHILTSGL